MSIGIASSNGKANIHTAGVTTDPKNYGITYLNKIIFLNQWLMHVKELLITWVKTILFI
ncbi:hypothetical protein SD457_12245 [Coprobacillaceae bacterium CR2/5/TPMF4]|nr:hypothetical protein SD457_12245 [Coprobacillaceae bacterium CR2/5/TPMF4]